LVRPQTRNLNYLLYGVNPLYFLWIEPDQDMRYRRSDAPSGDCQGGHAGLPGSNSIPDQEHRQILEDPVKVIFDKETDTLSIILREGIVADSDEPRPGMILDYDKAGRLVSIELLDASEQVKSPQSVEFALASSR
jgi:YD repeat-containing protein